MELPAATFWMQSSDISQNGYNTTTRLVAADRSYANLNFDDDVDDVGDRSGVAVEQNLLMGDNLPWHVGSRWAEFWLTAVTQLQG